MNRMSRHDLVEVGFEVIQFVPDYERNTHDPILALGTTNRIGNCASKAIIACCLIEIDYDILPAVGYNFKKHGEEMTEKTMLGRLKTFTHTSHIDCLVPSIGANGSSEQFDVLGLAFGMYVNSPRGYQREDKLMIENPNTAKLKYAQVVNGEVAGTRAARKDNYSVLPWREGVSNYYEKIGQPQPDFEEIFAIVEAFRRDEGKLPVYEN